MKIKTLFRLGTIALFSAFLMTDAYSQDNPAAVAEIEAHRKKQNEEFLSEKSPLEKKDRKKFKGLHYYPIDLQYRVKAQFVKTQNPVLFQMKTTTTRLPEYVKYGEVRFTLNGQDFALEVYQSPDIIKRPGYQDYLFIPFTDSTNGYDTYDIGRYLEFRIPTSSDVVVDFNLCYNPYCSYNTKYSCPIPPAANHLPVAIRAGEKKYKNK